MNMRSLTHKAAGSLSRLKLSVLALTLVLFANLLGVGHAAGAPQSYVPNAVPSVSTTLYSYTSSAIAAGRVAVDRAGNVYYIDHTTYSSTYGYTLYEIPAATPQVTASTVIPLIYGLAHYNANGVFVDVAGNLWLAAGGAPIEIPASGGIPDVAAITNGSTGTYSAANGLALSSISSYCWSGSTTPCQWSAASNVTGGYVQAADIYSDGAGNVVVLDLYDSKKSGAYNRVFWFNTSTPGTGYLLADTSTLSNNGLAQITVGGDGNVYYIQSTANYQNNSGAIYNLGSITSTSANTPVPVTTTATLGATATVSAASGVTTDPWGNLVLFGKNASGTYIITNVPLENGALNFADEYVMATSGYLWSGGQIDAHGNAYYCGYSSVVSAQIGGYNFGNVPVGTIVSSSAPTLNVYFNKSTVVGGNYFPTGSPTSNTVAAALQSFPYSGTKTISGGGSTYGIGTANGATGTAIVDFMPVHPGALKGSYAPRDNSSNLDFAVNLQGVGTGPMPMFLPGVASTLFGSAATSSSNSTALNLKAPYGIAVDTFGDIFIADAGNKKIVADCYMGGATTAAAGANITANNVCATSPYVGAMTGLSTGFTSPAGVAVDGTNSLYVTDSSANTLTLIQSDNLASTVLISGTTTIGGSTLNSPMGVAVDGYGNIDVADTANNRIVQAHYYGFGATVSANTVLISSATKFGGVTLSGPTGLAVDGSGNLFIADTGNNRVVEYSYAGATSVLTTTGVSLNAPTGVAVLPSGALIVTDSSNGVSMIDGGIGYQLSLNTAAGTILSAGTPGGVALDLMGNIYFTDSANNLVNKLNTNSPATSPAFPSTAQSTESADNDFYVYNSGNAQLTLSGLLLGDTTNFGIDTGLNTCTSTATVNAAADCTLAVYFQPQSAGTLSTTVTLTDNQKSVASLVTSTSNETATFSSTSSPTVGFSGIGIPPAGCSQSITFAPTTPISYTPNAITLGGTATSGLAVTYTVISGPGSVNGNQLTISGVGTVQVRASQTGGASSACSINGTYLPATPVTKNIVVNQASQTIVLAPPSSALTYTGGTINLANYASVGSGLTLGFAIDGTSTGAGSISGGVLTVTSAGQFVIDITQTGNTDYTAATPAQLTFTVSKGTATFTYTNPAAQTASIVFSPAAIALNVSANSGGTVTYSMDSASTGTASVSGNLLTITDLGSTGTASIVVDVNVAATALYSAATTKLTYAVTQASQAITFTPLASPVNYLTGPYPLVATSNSGLTVTFSVLSGPGTITGGNNLTLTGSGTVVVAADQVGNDNYSAATEQTQSVLVLPIAQTINFTALTSPVTYSTTPITLSATATSGLAVTFTVASGPATVTGSKLTLTNAGTVVVTASQAGNANFNGAQSVSQTLIVNPIGTVATPAFSVGTGNYTSNQTVTITEGTTGASVYYTTDGTTPSASSTLYSGAITIAGSTILKAIAIETGWTNSVVASASFTYTPDFTLALGTSSTSIVQGGTAISTVAVTPLFGFNSAVTLTCAGLPEGNSCTFSPATVTPSGAVANSTLTIVTSAPTTAALGHIGPRPYLPGATLAAVLCLFGLRKRRRLLMVVLLVLSAAGVGMMTGCNNSSMTTSGTNLTVTVTGTSGSVSHSTTMAIRVN